MSCSERSSPDQSNMKRKAAFILCSLCAPPGLDTGSSARCGPPGSPVWLVCRSCRRETPAPAVYPGHRHNRSSRSAFFLAQQEHGRDNHRHRQPPVYLLTVLQEVDVIKRHPHLCTLRIKRKIMLVGDIERPGDAAFQGGERASNVLGPGLGVQTTRKRERKQAFPHKLFSCASKPVFSALF